MTTSGARTKHVPHLNIANAFTFLRVALVPVFAWLLVVREPSAPILAGVVFALAAATDGVDGFVARRLDLVSGFGQFLDPLADKLLVGTALVALGAAGRITWWAVGIILARETGVLLLRLQLARWGRALPASRMAKTKTAAQMLAVMLATVRPLGDPWVAVAVAVAVVLTILSGVQYATDAARGNRAVDWQ